MLRHIFWPSKQGLISEVIIAILALMAFNLSSLSNQLLINNMGTTDPLSLWSQLLRKLLNTAQDQHIVQQVLLFGFWAIVGALIYILIFRAIQIFLRAEKSLSTGVLLVQQDHANGALRWFASLHDFLVKAIIFLIGIVAITAGSLVCFGIASQELNNGLNEPFPGNVSLFLFSAFAAVVSVRVIVLGTSLLSRRFRNWYTA